MKELSEFDYQDTFTVKCPPSASMSDVMVGFFNGTPSMVKVLMTLRNKLVFLIGLKTGKDRMPKVTVETFKQGQRIGIFEIGEIGPQAAIMGANDYHLNFRAIMKIENGILSCRTQVKYNNSLGRGYFLVVKPFHKLVVPAILKSSVRQLKSI